MYILLVILSVFSAACAQMLLKQGAQKQYPSFIRQYLNPWVVLGYSVMGMSLIVNVLCLNHGVKVKEISIMESFSYLFVPLLSYIFFKETITLRKIMAIAIIMTGVVVFFI